jgi:hypothetical protein
MTRIRLILLCALAVFAASAVASASASAANCEAVEEGGDFAVCLEGGTEYAGVLENLANRAVKTTFESKVLGAAVELKSTEAVAKLTAEDSGAGTGEIEFKHVKVEVPGPGKCSVKNVVGGVAETITAKFTSQLNAPPAAAVVGTFTGSGAAETFVEIEFNKIGAETCTLNLQKFKIKGSQKCVFNPNITTFEVHHALSCAEAGSSLFLGATAATFETGDEDSEEIDSFKGLEPVPNTGQKWAILES